MQKIVDQLELIVGQENLLADHASRLAYASRGSLTGSAEDILPLAIARPVHKGQLQKLLAWCTSQKIPLVFRGSGCQFGCISTPLQPDSLIILSTGLNRVYEADKNNYSIRVEAGALASSVQAVCAKAGLLCPVADARQAPFTVGGILADNKASPAYNAYGAPANYVSALEVFCTDGKKLRCCAGLGVAAGFAGSFPVPQIFCGSMGSLAFLSECELRLVARPARSIRLGWCFSDLEQTLAAAGECQAAQCPLPPSIEFYAPLCATLVCGQAAGKWLLCVDYPDGSPALAEELGERMSVSFAAEKIALSESFFGDAANLSSLLVKELGVYDYFSCKCRPGDFARFCKAIADLLLQSDQKVIVWGAPALGKIELAIAASEETEIIRTKLKELEQMFNDWQENGQELLLDPVTRSREQNRMARELLQSMATVFDPENLLAAQRAQWDRA